MARRAKQKHLKGMEPEEIPELTTAAEHYELCCTSTVELKKRKDESGDHLIDLMRKHELLVYEHDGLIVTRDTPDEKVKVKRAKDEGEPE